MSNEYFLNETPPTKQDGRRHFSPVEQNMLYTLKIFKDIEYRPPYFLGCLSIIRLVFSRLPDFHLWCWLIDIRDLNQRFYSQLIEHVRSRKKPIIYCEYYLQLLEFSINRKKSNIREY